MSYQTLLDNIPPSGAGGGCHPYLMRIANAGVREGHSRDAILLDIRANLDDSEREVGDREILDTVDHALADGGLVPQARRGGYGILPAFEGKQAVEVLASGSAAEKFSDLAAISPITICDDPVEQHRLFLRTMYKPDEYLFFGDDDVAGDRDSIRSAREWAASSPDRPKMILNPLDGERKPRKSGGTTMRGDGNVKVHRYCLFEADALDLKVQLKVWHTICQHELLPVAAIVYSGGKSLHALLYANCAGSEEWDLVLRGSVYPRVLCPLGADAACKNPARLCRAVGHRRQGIDSPKAVQRLLYLKGWLT